ncbi:MAG TPA: sulfotransferase [Mucilaginibacter sp.]
MLSKIIEAEQRLNQLLPAERLEGSPPAHLITAAGAWSNLVWLMAEQLGPMPLTAGQITQGLELVQKPVFICGVHRSGTTLLKDILDGHPDLLVLPSEGTFYTNLEFKLQRLPANDWAGFLGREWLRRIANPINQPPYWLLGHSDNTDSPYVNFARYMMAWWAIIDHKKGTQWPHQAIVLAYASVTDKLTAQQWVDKTPTNERFVNRIWREMPHAKIIHIVREPVATLTSRKKMEPAISLRNALGYLKTSFTIAAKLQRVNEPRFMLLRYEDLCNQPQKAIKQLAAFLNIKALSVLGRPSVAGMPSQANSSFKKETKAGVILKQDQQVQQEVLSIAEQQLIAACMAKLAAKQHYKLASIGLLRGLYLSLRYRAF